MYTNLCDHGVRSGWNCKLCARKEDLKLKDIYTITVDGVEVEGVIEQILDENYVRVGYEKNTSLGKLSVACVCQVC